MREMARRIHVSYGYLGQIERCEVAAPPDIAAAYIRVLEEESMNRRGLLAGLASIAALPASELAPANAGMSDVDLINEHVDYFTGVDLRYGGGVVAEHAQGALNWSTRLLGSHMRGTTRTRLHGAVAALSDRVGWALYDAGNLTEAMRITEFAAEQADRSEDADLRAQIKLNLSTMEYDAGDRHGAAARLIAALVDPRVSPAQRANLHIVCARHLAGAGLLPEAQRHVALGQDALGRPWTMDAPWARRVYAPGHLDAALGLALVSMGRPEDAAQRLTAALAAMDRSSRARTAVRCRTRLAVALHDLGDRAGAVEQAARARRDARGIKSARVAADIAAMPV